MLTVPVCACGVVPPEFVFEFELELPDEHPIERNISAADAAPSTVRVYRHFMSIS
jgi:hypothetical protein